MARLLSLPVLGAGALVASPALWDALVDGTMPIETALTRLLVAVVATWLGISLVGSLVEGTSAAARPTDEPAPGDGTAPLRASVVDPRP